MLCILIRECKRFASLLNIWNAAFYNGEIVASSD